MHPKENTLSGTSEKWLGWETEAPIYLCNNPSNIVLISDPKYSWMHNFSCTPLTCNYRKYQTLEAAFLHWQLSFDPRADGLIKTKDHIEAREVAYSLKIGVPKGRKILSYDAQYKMRVFIREKTLSNPLFKERLRELPDLYVLYDYVGASKDNIPSREDLLWGVAWDGKSWRGENKIGISWDFARAYFISVEERMMNPHRIRGW